MNMNQWRVVYRSLAIQEQPQFKPLHRLNNQLLDDYEKRSGFILPRSYRCFIKVFGPGELTCKYEFCAPGYPDQPEMIDLEKFNEDLKSQMTKSTLKRFSDPERIQRLVFFCRTGEGDLIGWDPSDVQNAPTREYGIYCWGRANAAKLIAKSFDQFINSVCLSEKNLNPRGWDEAELGPRRNFRPEYDILGDK